MCPISIGFADTSTVKPTDKKAQTDMRLCVTRDLEVHLCIVLLFAIVVDVSVNLFTRQANLSMFPLLTEPGEMGG